MTPPTHGASRTAYSARKRLGIHCKDIRDSRSRSKSLNHLLINYFDDPRIEDVIVALDMGDERKGKTGFIKSLGLLPAPSLAFIKRLAMIRNRLAHKIEYLDFKLAQYLSKMPDDDRNALVGSMQQVLPKTPIQPWISEDPRQVFFAIFCVILYQIETCVILSKKVSQGEDLSG